MIPRSTLAAQTSYDVVILYTSMALVAQTFIFGIFVVVFFLSIYLARKRGKRIRGDWLMYCAFTSFLLSAGFWGGWVANLVYTIQPSPDWGPQVNFFNLIMMLSCLLTDGVVVWRAWILCRDESRKLLRIPVVSLVLTALSVAAVFALRIVISGVLLGRPTPPAIVRAIDCTQVASVSLTVFTNTSATMIIALRVWKHRKSMEEFIRESKSTSTTGQVVLAFLVESGFIYCTAGIALLVSAVIKLPYGTLGDVLSPSAGQIVGMYPTLIVVVISMRMTIKETTLHASTIDFARPPLPQSRSRIPTDLPREDESSFRETRSHA